MDKLDQQRKTPEQLSDLIINLVKNGNFTGLQITALVAKLNSLVPSEVITPTDVLVEASDKDKKIESLRNKANELSAKFTEYQPNIRTQDTQDLLDFAAELYGVPRYTDGFDGKYIKWLQDLGLNGYYASQKLNAPKQALSELLKLLDVLSTPSTK